MVISGEPEVTRLSKEERIGQGSEDSRQKLDPASCSSGIALVNRYIPAAHSIEADISLKRERDLVDGTQNIVTEIDFNC